MHDKTLTFTREKAWKIAVHPLHWALMAYIAKNRGEKRSEAFGRLVEAVATWEDKFDAAAFQEFVTKELLPEETDVEAQGVLLAQVDEFVRTWRQKKR